MTTPGAKARTKGLQFERDCANRFRNAGWMQAKRHLEFQQAEACGHDLDGVDPFRVQCKCYKEYAPISTIKEIQYGPGQVPVLLTQPDDGRAVAVLYYDDLMRILCSLKAKGVTFKTPTPDDF